MKKVLIIGMTSILGGVETYLYNVVKFLDKKDIEIDFLVIGDSKKAVFENELVNILGCNKKHFYYTPSVKKNPIKAVKWLRGFYQAKMYDVIYMNTCTSARIVYCSYAINKLGAKLITHSHNGNAISKFKGINNRIFRHYTTKHSSVKVACSEKAYNWLFDDEFKEENIIPNGIDVDRFAFSEKVRNAVRSAVGLEGKVVIGHIGRFSVQKNHCFFIELAKQLDAHYQFLLIGDGDQKAKFIEQIWSNDLQERFTIIDVCGDIEKYYSAMDIFVMPSLFEGLPIVAVEAQCNGLHCVFSDTVSIQADISNNCMFVPLDNVKLWVDVILNCSYKRYDGKSIVRDAGFSIQNTSVMIKEIIDGLSCKYSSK